MLRPPAVRPWRSRAFGSTVVTMPDTDPPLRAQMTEAMEAIRHQLDLLRSSPTIGGPSDDRSVVAELQAEYEALREARAKLD